MFSLVTKWLLIIASFSWSVSFATEIDSRAALTKAVLELQKDLLIAEEQLLREDQQGIVIYLDTKGLSSPKLHEITAILDDKAIVKQELNPADTQALALGGIIKLYSSPLAVGEHELSIQLFENADTDHHLTKNFRFNKSEKREYIKVVISSFLGTQKQKIAFEQQQATP